MAEDPQETWIVLTVTAFEDSSRLTDQKKHDLCVMISVGCDRETACKFHRWSPADLQNEIQSDPKFAKELIRAEGTAEFMHMRTIHNAAKDPKNWRVSVWWLERFAPERFARRAPHAITATQLGSLVEQLAELIVNEVGSEEDRCRLLARMDDMIDQAVNEVFETPTFDPPIATEMPDKSDTNREAAK